MPPIEHVFFDVGATLIRPFPSLGEIYRRVLLPLGVEASAERYATLFGEVWARLGEEVGAGRDRYSAFGSEQAFWRTAVERVLRQLDAPLLVPLLVNDATDLLRREFTDPASWALFPDVEETLERLAGAGVRCGVISNWDSRLPALLDGLGLRGRLEPVVCSSEVGEEKPSPAIFHHALRRANAPAERSVHVGDDLGSDVRGAERAGMTGILLNRRNGAVPSGVRSIATLAELPGIVAAGLFSESPP